MHDLRRIAEEAARAGGAVLAAQAGNVTGIRTKSSATDMVTAADIASGVAIVRAIATADASARFVVEEPEVYELAGVTCGELDDSEVWVIDPLDGTTSFIHAYPCYSVSIACLRDGRPVAGAVYNVPTGEMASASAGDGAFLDDMRLICEGATEMSHALITTGFPYDRGAPLDRQLRIFAEVLRPAHDIRRDGSAAIDLCNVAIGRTDGFWETALKPWDMAAGVLIAEESGVIVTDLNGAPWTTSTCDVLAANAALHPTLLELISRAEAQSLPHR
ncbi:MAG: inositol monophosphatase family protein [Coriobacteriia bacterium]|nr:inositol monophosphatase family protein [Coriobacteriia bacterium]